MGLQLWERERESEIHTQTEGWIDGELTEQNIESDIRRERKAGMSSQFEEGDGKWEGTRKHLKNSFKKPVPILCVSGDAWSSQPDTTLLASGAALITCRRFPLELFRIRVIRYLHDNDRQHLLLLLAYHRFGSSCSAISTSFHLNKPPCLQQQWPSMTCIHNLPHCPRPKPQWRQILRLIKDKDMAAHQYSERCRHSWTCRNRMNKRQRGRCIGAGWILTSVNSVVVRWGAVACSVECFLAPTTRIPCTAPGVVVIGTRSGFHLLL